MFGLFHLCLFLGTWITWVNLTLVIKDVAALLSVSGKSTGQVYTVLPALVAAYLHVLPLHYPLHYSWILIIFPVIWMWTRAVTTALHYTVFSMFLMLIFFLTPESFKKPIPAFCLSLLIWAVNWNSFSLKTWRLMFWRKIYFYHLNAPQKDFSCFFCLVCVEGSLFDFETMWLFDSINISLSSLRYLLHRNYLFLQL